MEQPDEVAAIRELAQRLLALPFLHSGNAREGAQLVVQALPPGLPLDLPITAGGRLLGCATRGQGPRPGAPVTGQAIDMVLDCPGEVDEIFGYYEDVFSRQGWTVREEASTPHFGGFQSMRLPPSRTFCKSMSGPWASVRVLATDAGMSDVRVHIDTSGPGPCAMPSRGLPIGAGLLPSLTAPVAVPMDQLSGGGGSGGWSSTALATTDRSCAELETHFGGQLEAADWARQESRQTESLAWSSWTCAGKEGWRALLLVAEEPAGRRLLHVRAELAGGGGIHGTGWAGWVGSL